MAGTCHNHSCIHGMHGIALASPQRVELSTCVLLSVRWCLHIVNVCGSWLRSMPYMNKSSWICIVRRSMSSMPHITVRLLPRRIKHIIGGTLC